MSFRFSYHDAGCVGAIARRSHIHTGHTPGDKLENKKNPVLPETEDFIMEQLAAVFMIFLFVFKLQLTAISKMSIILLKTPGAYPGIYGSD